MFFLTAPIKCLEMIKIVHYIHHFLKRVPITRWVPAGSTTVPRQGGQIALLEGRPTVLGGFFDYDKYPQVVEQFDVDTGGGIFDIIIYNIVYVAGFWFPMKNKLRKGRRYFGLALVPETLFPQCI